MSSGAEADSTDDEEEEVTPDSEPEVEQKTLPKRSTRGKRMHALVGDEADADEAFWGQSAFQENAEDDLDYAFVEQEDIVDSDIDLSEGDEPEAQEVVPEKKKRSSGAYREPASLRALKRRMASSKGQKPAKRMRKVARHPSEKMSLRRSTKSMTKEVAVRQSVSKGKHVGKKRVREEYPRLTQEEMLMTALVTEQVNRQSLKNILSDAAKKKKRMAPKEQATGPMIRFHSRKNPPKHSLTFTDVSRVPVAINSRTCAYTKRATTCVITGLPAKYRDPRSGLPYANLDAFRELRRREDTNEGEK